MGRSQSFDWSLFILALILSISGIVYIYSATWVALEPPRANFLHEQGGLGLAAKQMIFLGCSLLAFAILSRLNWGLKADSWLWYYVPIVSLLSIVLLAGVVKGGSRRWINLGPVDLQPSEFAKLGFVMILAWLYSAEPALVRRRYITALILLGSLVGLVMLQPDLGTSMVFIAVFFVMSAFAALPRRWLAYTALGLSLLAIPAWFMMHDYQQKRVISFLKPDADPQGSGYHLQQSRIAVGSGGLTGKGFLRGTQSRGGFIPVIESDFIFALVGEEFGFFGCFWLLLLYFLLLARILALSRDAKTQYERLICYGSSAVILFHVFVSTGMSIGLMPVTGLPLPFVAYGGSSLLTMWTFMAIIESIFANSRRDFRKVAYPR